VKNGDRWTLAKVRCDRSLTVGHNRIGRAVRLRPLMSPSRSSWARAHCPGSHADTMHGPATSEADPQPIANYLYLQVVGDRDPHSLVWPKTVRPRMATDLLRQILAPTICPGPSPPCAAKLRTGRPAR
jgi:hypothetical protein